MTAALPVQHGTAEALARVQHFRGLTDALPDAHELDPVARFLIGRVTDPAEVLEQITDELDQLWSLVTEDFDDDQLDELTEDDWARHSFATQQQEVDFRHSLTIARLMYAIEAHIALHRVIYAENGRTVRTGAAASAVDAAAMKAESEARFEAQVMAGPIVDNASDRLYAIGELEYDGPRCADEDCDTPVADDDARCDDCASRCTDCGRDVSRPGRCFDCDVRSSYVGGFAPRFGAQP